MKNPRDINHSLGVVSAGKGVGGFFPLVIARGDVVCQFFNFWFGIDKEISLAENNLKRIKLGEIYEFSGFGKYTIQRQKL